MKAQSISKAQKVSIVIGAAVFGAICVGSLTLMVLTAESPPNMAISGVGRWVASGFNFLCCIFFVMVLGAWLGGVVCVVWRSPPGKCLFWMLSGGSLGGIVSLAGANDWMLRENRDGARTTIMTEMLVFGAVILAGTLLGLLLGLVVGRRRQRAAAPVEVS